MKIFLNKLKKISLIKKIVYFSVLISYWICYIFFAKSILSLVGIENEIRIILCILFFLYGLIYAFFGLVKMLEKKKIAFAILSIFTVIFAVIFGFGSYYIDKLYNKIENFAVKDTSTYTTVLLSLKDSTFTDESIIGMITDEEDRTGYILPLEMIQKESINNEIEYYSNTIELLDALYNNEVDAIFINKDFPILYSNEEKYQNIAAETIIIKEYSKEMKTEESELLVSTKSLTEPFTVLVLGVDSESTGGLDANAAFNGDTLMLVTFNPKTLTATMLSIPRDMYVPIISGSGRSLGYSKINSSAAYGTASTVNTMENLTGIEIDYFVKVNFRGVIDLVEALGGIDVFVEQPDYQYYVSYYGEGKLCESNSLRDMVNVVCMNTGWQHLNGEQALAYARNRHGFLESDIARNRHQQQIIEAIAKKLVKTSSFSDFEKILDTISNNIATNMKTSQILSFYQSLKGMLMQALSGEDFITIQKTQLTYFTFDRYGISCLGYYQNSLDAITKAMKENLGIIEVETIKTFEYDYSVDFEQTSEIIGKGIYSGGRVPDSSITNPIIVSPEPEEDDSSEENNENDENDVNNENEESNSYPENEDNSSNEEDNSQENPENNTTEEDNSSNSTEENIDNDNNEEEIPGSPTNDEELEDSSNE